MRKHGMLILALLLTVPALTWAAEGSTLPAWLEKIKFSADFRYRHELIAAESAPAAGETDNRQNPDRNRHRIRLRVGIGFEVNPLWSIDTRFATSTSGSTGGDPISTNQDLTGAFSPKPVWVDRAYVDFHPLKGLSFRGGRFAVPYEGTDLVWDGDLNLEGLAITALSKKFAGSWELLGRAGGYWPQERSAGPDVGLLGAQGGIRYAGDPIGAQITGAYYDYTNIRNAPVLLGAFGNTLNAAGNYLNDYGLLDVNGQFKVAQESWEATLLGDFVLNTAADSAETGFLVGTVVKFIKLPIDWELGYNYRDLEADATVATFTDSDSRGGGTNFNGHKLSLFFTVVKNTRLGANYFMNVIDPDGAKLDYNRLQIDLEAKF